MILKILKRVNRYLPEDFRLRLLPYYRRILPGLNNVIFIPQLKCNYNCAYCIWNRFTPDGFKDSFHHFTDWVRIFQTFPPSAVIITGGEPLLYRDIVPLIENFPDKHVISCLVTNLSVNIDKLISLKKKEFRIMASFHPYTATKEAFMQGLISLKAAGFKNITVNFVAYPEYLKDIPVLKKFFEQEKGLYFRTDTFKDPDYKYSGQELELIREYKKKGFIAPDRTEGYSFEDFSAKACRAGKNLFIIIANGNVYSCMEGYYYSECKPYKDKYNKIDKFYLGNVFDGSFNASEKNRVCHSPCAELCDLELAGVRRISVSS